MISGKFCLRPFDEKLTHRAVGKIGFLPACCMKGDFKMTRDEWLRRTSAQVQNLRERIAASGEECLQAEEEHELQGLERKLETLAGGKGCDRRKSFI